MCIRDSPDAVRLVLALDVLAQRVQGVLAQPIAAVALVILNARLGTDVEDVALALPAHVRQNGAAHQERPAQIDGHHLIPGRHVVIVDMAPPANACVVDENVDRAEVLQRCGDDSFGCLLYTSRCV